MNKFAGISFHGIRALRLTFLVAIEIIFSIHTQAQSFIVESGYLSVGPNTALTLSDISMVSNSAIFANETSEFVLNNTNTIRSLSGKSAIRLSNLKLTGSWKLNTSMILSGNLQLQKAMLDLQNFQLEFQSGNILGENEQSRVFSTGNGSLVKKFDLLSGVTSNPGNFGLIIESGTNLNQLEIRRNHSVQQKSDGSGISRVLLTSYLNAPVNISFTYFEAELEGISGKNLQIWDNTGSGWQALTTDKSAQNEKKLSAVLETGEHMLTLFEDVTDGQLVIPNGFSPNNDGFNDFFIIKGIEAYPKNKLIIFNQWGDILFEIAPYENNWGGENMNGSGISNKALLPDGTYFYMFFPDKNNNTNLRKGFVEIKSGQN